MKNKFCLTQDDDCHWYVIPVDKMDEWNDFLEDEESAYKPLPDFAKQVGGSPSNVHFGQFIIK